LLIFIYMKTEINEIKRMQQLAGIISESQLNEFDINQFSSFGGKTSTIQPKSSFEGKWTDIDNKEEFIEKFNIDATSPLVNIVSRAIGSYNNYAITNENGKFFVYTFRQITNPGTPSSAFNSIDDAKKSVKEIA